MANDIYGKDVKMHVKCSKDSSCDGYSYQYYVYNEIIGHERNSSLYGFSANEKYNDIYSKLYRLYGSLTNDIFPYCFGDTLCVNGKMLNSRLGSIISDLDDIMKKIESTYKNIEDDINAINTKIIRTNDKNLDDAKSTAEEKHNNEKHSTT